jgi:hypothetical protein
MSKAKPPQFLADLYADLRDRHLLLPVLVLVVAVVAVPMALAHSAATPSAATPAATGDEASAIAPAVLADQRSGVRAYQKRLADRRGTNPFTQHFTSVPKSAQLQGASDAGAAPAAADATAGTTSTTATPTGSSPSAVTQSSTTTPPEPPTTTPSGGGHGGSHTQTRLFVHRIDVMFGTADDMKRIDGVKILTGLPAQSPVVTFLGTNDQGKKALFSVSPDVDSVDVEGRCTPGPTNCRYLVMAAGQTTKLHYAPNDTTYRLRLVRVRTVELSGHHDFQLKSKQSG